MQQVNYQKIAHNQTALTYYVSTLTKVNIGGVFIFIILKE